MIEMAQPQDQEEELNKMESQSSDWRDTVTTLEERIKHIFKISFMTDLTIKIVCDRPVEFKVHSVFLSMASAVFESLITSNMIEGISKIVEIKDVKPEIFHQLLQFLYGYVVELTDMEQAWELFVLADKYLVNNLKDVCLNYIEANVTAKNCCMCLQMAERYNLMELKEKSLLLIRRHTKDIVTDSSFFNVDATTVQTILEQKRLNLREFDLFKAVESWINFKVAEQEEEAKETLCNMLIPKFHFLCMTPKEFTDGPFKSGLMQQYDVLAIFGNLCSADCHLPLPDGFQTTKRMIINELKMENLGRSCERYSCWCIKFKVNKNIRLKAIKISTLEGNEGDSYKEDVEVRLRSEDSKTWESTTKFTEKVPYSSVCHVELPEFEVVKGKKYDLGIYHSKEVVKKVVNLEGFAAQDDDTDFNFYKHSGAWTPTIPIVSILYK